ncbi:hypothetical protein DFH06DRAFT_1323648 [Mycena polygramma]|nr:hypothetical protein DFH06DRAFT_1323648 [Mycena polygramma]
MSTVLVDFYRVVTYMGDDDSGDVSSYAVHHSLHVDYSAVQAPYTLVLVTRKIGRFVVHDLVPNVVPPGCRMTQQTLQQPQTLRDARTMVRYSARGAPIPLWSFEFDGMHIVNTVVKPLLPGVVVALAVEVKRGVPLSSTDPRCYRLSDVVSGCLIARGSRVALPLSFVSELEAVKLLETGSYYCVIQCVDLGTLEPIVLEVSRYHVNFQSFHLGARVLGDMTGYVLLVHKRLRRWVALLHARVGDMRQRFL